jgi:hypothetical protein
MSKGVILGINQCKDSKAIIRELTNYVVEVEYKEAYLIFELSSQFSFIAKNKAFYRQQDRAQALVDSLVQTKTNFIFDYV